VAERLHVAFEVEKELEGGNGEFVVGFAPVAVRQAVDAVGVFHGAWLGS
jgi:hypothetical protein